MMRVPFYNADYALIQVVPHTTQGRGIQFEMGLSVSFQAPDVFNVQGMLAVPTAKFLHRLGTLSTPDMVQIELVMRSWLGLGG